MQGPHPIIVIAARGEGGQSWAALVPERVFPPKAKSQALKRGWDTDDLVDPPFGAPETLAGKGPGRQH
ncbi:hypothetical protein CSOJ01_06696 [Colletotrichum sojae]|uniref:Uncharacterized protein n=1 Tax=Colletotrichum sojae TaxID=2175907 RepID=A0A8H6MVL2_9PEZI|nr:hypothetical protein CSOJ01_06696 [Colletotrichum sojae]